MAMLAEPRRRKRYNLCPRGKALYEDENRFGTKMLEKMGWTKGSGLGANLSGEKDFVRIRFKNDAEGLGFEQRDDQWTVHEDGFNGLLKALNGDDSGANDKEPESEEEARPMGFGFKAVEPEEPSKKKLKENTSGMSLEERSKQSRARVHYKKFTRGKDLAQYSEKDLANIFGKKPTEDVERYPEPVLVVQPEEQKEENPNFAGVQTIITGLSTTDYFKQKMEAMKNRLKKGASSQVEDSNEPQTNGHDEKLEQTSAENDELHTKKKKKKKDKERTEESPTAVEELEQVAPKPKKKKKSKHSSPDETESVEKTDEPPTAVEEIEQDAPKLKKKKKSKQSSQDETEQSRNNFAEEKLVKSEEGTDESPIAEEKMEQGAPEIKKKKKSKKESLDETEKSDNICVELEEITEQSEHTSSKRKKSKKKEEAAEEIQINEQAEESDKKKKRKKDKNKEISEDLLEEPAAKKKKKSKKTEEVIIIDDVLRGNNESEAANENASKKKIKSNSTEEASQRREEITIDLTDEAPTKKKKKSNEEKRSKDTDEKDSVETPPTTEEATEKKTKNKRKSNASKEPLAKLEISSLALAVQAAVGNSKDSGGEDGDDVSAENNMSGDKSVESADEVLPKNLLSLEEIHEKLKSFNYFNISKFCADQFYLFDMSAFNNSTLGEIAGYGMSENVELNVVNCLSDEKRIRNLWKNKAVENFKSEKHIKYPVRVQKTSIRAVKKRTAFQGI
ncbi:trichohyalin isoform X1 [Drosophila erecta]|uniref:G-patch domain-containing protein n=1 Tax=Drosophila erecta TaxID=7220 RepID=B3NJR2_DROER|nr:trichohyalin isoform X1 [Drosophila erecta]EDV55331.1 uncharacterized protein Dere_GG20845 [Drosophila erecta]